jgi:hypothetical protein
MLIFVDLWPHLRHLNYFGDIISAARCISIGIIYAHIVHVPRRHVLHIQNLKL